MKRKGQGSIEYLLIIGGGILVAIIVVSAITALAGTGSSGSKQSIANQTCHARENQISCEQADLEIVESVEENCPTGNPAKTECCWDEDKPLGEQCYVNPTAIYT